MASRGVRHTLVVFAAACASLLATNFLLSLVLAGHWRAFDEWMVRAFRTGGDFAAPIGSRAIQIAVRDATALGGTLPLIVLISVVALYLYLKQHTRTALAVVASTLLGVIVSQILKAVIDRGRPEIVPQLVPEVSGSFPSGHAMMSAIVYLTLGTMLARLEPEKVVRRYIVGVAMVLTITVGLSRVYLGVHWPSDVLGGWALGALWVVAVSQILDWAVKRTGGA